MDMSPICSSDNEQLQPNQKVLCFMLLRGILTLQSSLHFFPAVADSCIVEGYKLKRPAKMPHAIINVYFTTTSGLLSFSN